MRCPSQPHVSLEGKEVDKDLINFQAVCDKNRRNLLERHFIDGENRSNIKIQTVYTTPEDRSVAENICSATKEEILRRAGEKLQLLSDEETKDELLKELDNLQKNLQKSKKEHLLKFYDEIMEELEHADVLETVCHNVEIEDDGN